VIVVPINWPTNDDVLRFHGIVSRNVKILRRDLENLTTYSKKYASEKAQQVVDYTRMDCDVGLDLIEERLGSPNKSVESYLELSDEFFQLQYQFIRLVSMKGWFEGFRYEEFEEFEDV
jgi:hypothetical protein